MSLKYLLAALLALLLSLSLACAEEGGRKATSTPTAATPSLPSPFQESFPLTVKDDHGKAITLPAAPQRVVALAPSFIEVLFAIGAGDSLVAVDENSDFPPEAAAKPKISGFQPSVEGIAGLRPDLVIIFFDPGDLQSSLERLGIPVLFLATPATVGETLDQIGLLGRASGHGDEARQLVAQMQEGIDAITAKLAAVQQGPRVFHELDPTLFTTCPGEFVHDMYALLKARNIAEQVSGACQMSNEALIQADPEVIILADEPSGESPQTVAARPGWDQISAVRNGRVHSVDPDIVSRPGPRIVDAMETLARLLYPERFP